MTALDSKPRVRVCTEVIGSRVPPFSQRMTPRPLTVLLFIALAVAAMESHAQKPADATAPTKSGSAGKKPAPPDYIRFHEDEKGAQLQTAVARFENAKGVRVELIGAVHIADKAYYAELNARFKTCEIVLYELVGGEFKDREKLRSSADADRMKWVGWLQETMKHSLGLTGQLEGIDYTARNFVHADMTTGQFFGTQEKKQESFVGLLFKAWKAQVEVAAQGDLPDQPGLAKILEILCRKDSPTELKRLVGREFDQIERIMAGVESDGGTVIIGERNRVALEVLNREIAKGRKHLGIFYGAAHLADMEQRLAGMGFQKKAVEWMTAWDLPPEPRTEAAESGGAKAGPPDHNKAKPPMPSKN